MDSPFSKPMFCTCSTRSLVLLMWQGNLPTTGLRILTSSLANQSTMLLYPYWILWASGKCLSYGYLAAHKTWKNQFLWVTSSPIYCFLCLFLPSYFSTDWLLCSSICYYDQLEWFCTSPIILTCYLPFYVIFFVLDHHGNPFICFKDDMLPILLQLLECLHFFLSEIRFVSARMVDSPPYVSSMLPSFYGFSSLATPTQW